MKNITNKIIGVNAIKPNSKHQHLHRQFTILVIIVN